MNIGFILFILTIIAIGALIYTIYWRQIRVEGFIDPSGAVVDPSGGVLTLPTNKRELLVLLLNTLRTEIARLNGLNQTDIVVIKRIQNLTFLRDALQQLYVDLMENRIQDSDIEFGPEEVAVFLPFIGPQADMNRELPNLLNTQLNTISTTLSALRDANIYWNLELGVQNYNPHPPPIIARPSIDSYKKEEQEQQNTDSTRGNNAQTVDGRWSVPSPDDPIATDRSWSNFTTNGRIPASLMSGYDPLDYKQRLKTMCDGIVRGEMGDYVRDFGCLEKNEKVDANFNYKSRYYTVCERLGATWGLGYQRMLGCPAEFTN